MPCYLTSTGAYLPGPVVSNEQIERYLGSLEGEAQVKAQVLAMNGITGRHYAQDDRQRPTENVYDMAAKAAAAACLKGQDAAGDVSFLAAGTTYAPYAGPGLASLIHAQLAQRVGIDQSVEVSSHAGICTSAAAAIVHAVRAVNEGQHDTALAIGAEHASEVLKASAMTPVDDRHEHEQLKDSQWFMSVFLRFMLSDGAGAFLLQSRPARHGLSFKVDWTYSRSMAHAHPLCMKLESRTGLLTQDIRVLNRHFYEASEAFVGGALATHGESLRAYAMLLPHLSSFFFLRRMMRVVAKFAKDRDEPLPWWTNLATAGNTGSASIFVMLDALLREQTMRNGDRLLLFIPESGQFNFVLISLTVVVND